MKHDSAWAGFYLHTASPISPSEFTKIRLSVHGGPTGGQRIRLAAYDTAGGVAGSVARAPHRRCMDAHRRLRTATAGLLTATVSLVAGWLAFRAGGPVQTVVFLTLGLGQLGVALALRAPRHGATWRDRGLEAAVLVAGLCQLAGVLVPGLRDLLGTDALAGQQILVLSAAAAIPGLAVAAGRAYSRRRESEGRALAASPAVANNDKEVVR